MAATRRFGNIDWESIHEEYVAGQFSLKEIARQHGCSDTAIRLKAKELGWQRRLAERVREQVREKLLRGGCTGDTNANQLPATDDQIVDVASDRGAEVVRLDRNDINKLRQIEQRLLNELGDPNNPPQKTHVSSHMGMVTVTPLPLTLPEKCSALQALANVQYRRIQLERQAYNLDDEGAQKKQATLADILAEIDGRARSLPGGDQ
jgi:hypothetical protein